MKKLILLFSIIMISISCSTDPKPIEHHDNSSYLTFSEKQFLQDFDTLSKPAKIIIEGTNVLIKTDQNLTYKAKIISGTDYMFFTFGTFIILLLFSVIGLVVLVAILMSNT